MSDDHVHQGGARHDPQSNESVKNGEGGGKEEKAEHNILDMPISHIHNNSTDHQEMPLPVIDNDPTPIHTSPLTHVSKSSSSRISDPYSKLSSPVSAYENAPNDHPTLSRFRTQMQDKKQALNIIQQSQIERQLFIFSWSGRPIFSRYGDTFQLASLMALLSSIISFIAQLGDTIQSIRAGKTNFVFKLFGPLWIVSISSIEVPLSMLESQISLIHLQLISLFTNQIESRLQTHPNYDLGKLLGTNEKYLNSLLDWMEESIDFILSSNHPFRISSSIRSSITSIIKKYKGDIGETAYILIIAQNKLVQIVQTQANAMNSRELNVLLNFIRNTPSLRYTETWLPVCVPSFDPAGFLHQYGCYLGIDIVLVALSTSVDEFYFISQYKNELYHAMENQGLLQEIYQAFQIQSYKVEELGVDHLIHFIYKTKQTQQMTMPAYPSEYQDKSKIHLVQWYQLAFSRIHQRANQKTLFMERACEQMIAIMTKKHELYAIFQGWAKKEACMRGCEVIFKWIQDNQTELFIDPIPTWK